MRRHAERTASRLLAALPAALNAVSPSSQLLLRMHYLDELTLVEIAEALELSVGTVKSRLAYGLAALRKVLGRVRPSVERHWHAETCMRLPEPPPTLRVDRRQL